MERKTETGTFGHFDDGAREYVVTRPDTPRPWSNYIGSSLFGGIVTNNAAGYTFYRSAAQGRLTRFQFNSQPADLKGRYLYLRDADDGDFWSQSWMPVGKPLEAFETVCRHGTGYTTIESTYREIYAETTYFVPLGEQYECWKISISNRGERPRRIQLFPFVEPQCNWSAEDDHRNLQYNQYIVQTGFEEGLIDIGSNVNMPEDRENFTNKDQARHVFFGVSGIRATGFDANLQGFMGPYGNLSRPLAVVEGKCSGSHAYGDMPAAALKVNRTLEPGEECCFTVVLGVGRAAEAGRRAIDATESPDRVRAALDAVKADWSKRLQRCRVETPDPLFNAMANTWAPYNNLMTFYWSRAASLVYTGERDGLGYRDSAQDLVGTAGLIPEETRERLLLLLSGQYANGGCMPVVQPFNHHPGREALTDHFRADDGLWLFNAVPAYVKESGDLNFYCLEVPFADHGAATVRHHLRRALEFNLQRTGEHGLPCGLHADWNDCLRLGEKGESIFVALQLRFALREYQEICTRTGEPEEAAWASAELEALDHRLNEHAWDGEWYLRAYRYDGLRFGSKACTEGSIFMNPQVWAVLSGHAQGDRARQVMDSMDRELCTEFGIMLCSPPYVSTDPEVCLARLFNPGTKENAGIFNHTQGWAVMAAARAGLGDRAWQYLNNVLPSSFNGRADLREVEPYVVCQSTHSTFSPRFGAGRVSWLSGAAVWNYVAMTQSILGIVPDYDGLRLQPCIPSSWGGFTAERIFRGSRYMIKVEQSGDGECGLKELTVDGTVIDGNQIPIAEPGSEIRVRAKV